MEKITSILLLCIMIFLSACGEDFDENKEKNKLIGTWEGVFETNVRVFDITVIFTDNSLLCYTIDRNTKWKHIYIDGSYQIVKEGVINYQNKDSMQVSGGTTNYSLNNNLLDISAFNNLKKTN